MTVSGHSTTTCQRESASGKHGVTPAGVDNIVALMALALLALVALAVAVLAQPQLQALLGQRTLVVAAVVLAELAQPVARVVAAS